MAVSKALNRGMEIPLSPERWSENLCIRPWVKQIILGRRFLGTVSFVMIQQGEDDYIVNVFEILRVGKTLRYATKRFRHFGMARELYYFDAATLMPTSTDSFSTTELPFEEANLEQVKP